MSDGYPSAPITVARTDARYLLFSLNVQRYGLPLSRVQQVLAMVAVYRPPVAPALLAGFLNLHGRAVPVVSLAELFGAPTAEPGLYSHLILLRAQPELALLVDRVDEVVLGRQQDIAAVQAGYSFNECAAGMLTLESGAVVLLDVERLLLAKEQQLLANLTAQQQRRLDDLGTTDA